MIERIRRAATTAPGFRDLQELLLAAALFAASAAGLGLATGLFAIQPAAPAEVAQAAAIALVFPALGEEIVFRALLVPDRQETSRPWPAIAVSTLVFVLWHLVEAFTILSAHRALFIRPDFLACAAMLGLVCAVLRHRSGSVWTAVALHWAGVVGWTAWLGGPSLRF